MASEHHAVHVGHAAARGEDAVALGYSIDCVWSIEPSSLLIHLVAPAKELPDVAEHRMLYDDEGGGHLGSCNIHCGLTSNVWMLVLRASESQEPARPYSSAPWYSWL